MYTMLVFGDAGAIYRRVHLVHFKSNGIGRIKSVRIRVETPISEKETVYVYQGEQLLCVLGVKKHEEMHEVEHVYIPMLFQYVSIVDIWEESNPHDTVPFTYARIENICGKLESQEMAHLCRSGVVRPINKCFGRKYAVYGLHGNITFDNCLCIPQFRAVRDLEKFRKQLQILNMEMGEMTVHLMVVCMSLGRQVSVNENSTLVQFLRHVDGFTFTGGCLDEQSTNLCFKFCGKYPKMKTNVTITRRGCILVHVSWHGVVCLLNDDLVDEVLDQANMILQSVSSVC